jgi:hypothetical protein
MNNYLLLPKLLIGLLQISYGTLLLHIWLLHFAIVMHHSFKFNLETLQIVVSFWIELIKLNIFLF